METETPHSHGLLFVRLSSLLSAIQPKDPQVLRVPTRARFPVLLGFTPSQSGALYTEIFVCWGCFFFMVSGPSANKAGAERSVFGSSE